MRVPGNDRSVFPWVIGVFVLTLSTLTGCAEVKVVDATPIAVTPDLFTSPPQPEVKEHNLAVVTVDFDPPLNYQQLILRHRGVSLLVAIENTGTSTERDVTVRAELTTPQDPTLIFTQGASIASIAPGEIQVVRFSRFGEILYYRTFHLEVAVDPVAGENELDDNRKAFDIQINEEE